MHGMRSDERIGRESIYTRMGTSQSVEWADSGQMDFVQGYNSQVVVEDGCQLIVAQAVTQEARAVR
jgi:hypothetical protein